MYRYVSGSGKVALKGFLSRLQEGETDKTGCPPPRNARGRAGRGITQNAIAQHPEDGEHAQTNADADTHFLQQVSDQEDERVERQEGEDEFLSWCLLRYKCCGLNRLALT